MLEHLNHPFLCNLRYSFQDIEYLYVAIRSHRAGHSPHDRYIVVDLMNGGDLRFHISRKTFTEEAVRFWMAELGCALRYIHQQGIIHRDVKPDNILLDSQGHLHLADFVRIGCVVAATGLMVGRMSRPNSGPIRNYTANRERWPTSPPRSTRGQDT
jgi:serine/threonine protein kinase